MTDSLEQLNRVEDELERVLKAVEGLNVLRREPIGVVEVPLAALRWLGPSRIEDAATGIEQDVTHVWRLELTVGVDVDQPELAQDELREYVQRVTAAVRDGVERTGEPNLGDVVDLVRVSLSQEADYFRRVTLTGDASGPLLYGLVLRVEADFTEA